MKGLAWDDKPEEYMDNLRGELARYYKIDLIITKKFGEFQEKFTKGDKWDFVVLDLMKDPEIEGDEEISEGFRISRIVRQTKPFMPIFFVTYFHDKFFKNDVPITRPYFARSKTITSDIMAYEIKLDLETLGLYSNPRKVFIIYGHDRASSNATMQVIKWLGAYKIKPIKVTDADQINVVWQGILEKMNECSAIIAICTPDDMIESIRNVNAAEKKVIYFQPRQNVLMEIGMAIGLTGGLRRLVILQKYIDKGNETEVEDSAILPSNLEGILTLRFKKDVSEIFNTLEKRLKTIGVQL